MQHHKETKRLALYFGSANLVNAEYRCIEASPIPWAFHLLDVYCIKQNYFPVR